jgi:phosphoglucomutase
LTLLETLDYLKQQHRRASFLFFNSNTFATIGRELALAVYSDLPPARKREVSSAFAHYIAGVLGREAMVSIVDSFCEAADWKTGDRVKTLRGSLRGVIVRIRKDGRVVWKPDGTENELTALPESLCRDSSGS